MSRNGAPGVAKALTRRFVGHTGQRPDLIASASSTDRRRVTVLAAPPLLASRAKPFDAPSDSSAFAGTCPRDRAAHSRVDTPGKRLASGLRRSKFTAWSSTRHNGAMSPELPHG